MGNLDRGSSGSGGGRGGVVVGLVLGALLGLGGGFLLFRTEPIPPPDPPDAEPAVVLFRVGETWGPIAVPCEKPLSRAFRAGNFRHYANFFPELERLAAAMRDARGIEGDVWIPVRINPQGEDCTSVDGIDEPGGSASTEQKECLSAQRAFCAQCPNGRDPSVDECNPPNLGENCSVPSATQCAEFQGNINP